MTALAILFAHGAGLGSRSPWMRAWSDRLSSLGNVITFDYPYMEAGKKRPDPHAVLLARHREQLHRVREWYGERVVLAGKSMGARMGCHLALEERVLGLVCFGYPLVAAGTGALRDEVLRKLASPILFIQGTKDRLCPLDKLEAARQAMQARNELDVVKGGDHSLIVGKRDLAARAQTQADVNRQVVETVRRFLAGLGE